MIITVCCNVMPRNLVEMRNVAVNFRYKTRRHTLYCGKFHGYHNGNFKSQAVHAQHKRQFEYLFSSLIKKTVKQGTFCTSYLMPLAMLLLPRTPSCCILGVCTTKLPVFLLGMDSMTGMIFPAGLFHRTHNINLLHGRFGQPVGSSNATVNPLTQELNSSAQRCLTRFFTGDFVSWTVHFVHICVKNYQIQQLFIPFFNYVWYLLDVSALDRHLQGSFLVLSKRCSIEEQSSIEHLSEGTRNAPWRWQCNAETCRSYHT
jgi:hypothetical protein